MRIVPAALAGCLLVVASLPIRAQAPAHPNLSGVWKFVSFTPAPPIPAFAEDLTIDQGGDALVITRIEKFARPPAAAVPSAVHDRYVFNGTETPNHCGVSKAGWDGPRLIIVTTHPAGGSCVSPVKETKEVLYLDGEGNLVIESSGIARNPRPGDSAPNSTSPIVRTTRYKRAS